MPGMLAIAAPLALLVPLIGQSSTAVTIPPPVNTPSVEEHTSPVANNSPTVEPAAQLPSAASPLKALYDSNVVHQVRIERRVTIRIAPQRPSQSSQLLAQLPQQGLTTQFEERKMDKCLAVEGIAGVQTGSGNRLLLFLRDRRIVSLNLEKACRARDFYSGFYVEKNEDGKLCVSRDKLQSRSGVKCEVARMRQLVAVEN